MGREDTTESLYVHAGEAEADGDFIGALSSAGEILRRQPAEDYARLKVAMILSAMAQIQGRVRAGWDLEARALDVALEVAKILVDRGQLLFAVAAVRAAIELDPDDAEIGPLLEQIYERMAELPAPYGDPQVTGPTALPPVETGDLPTVYTDDRDVFEQVAALAVAPLDAPAAPSGNVPIFAGLTRECFGDLVRQAVLRRLPADHVVIQQGERDASVFVTLHGSVDVSRSDGEHRVQLGRIRRGAIFGEMALIHTKPRSATVRSVTPVDLIEITGDHVAAVAASHPEIAAELERVAAARVLVRVFDRSRLLDGLERADREALVSKMTYHALDEGEVVLEEDVEPTGLFLIVSGTVSVTKAIDGEPPLELARLGAGQFVGEIALIQRTNTTARVTTVEPTVVFHLDHLAFDRLLAQHPTIRDYVAGVAKARVDEAQAATAGEADTVSMVL